jgi:hypothetical protein
MVTSYKLTDLQILVEVKLDLSAQQLSEIMPSSSAFYRMIYYKNLKIPMWLSESVNRRRTDNTMAKKKDKRTNNDLHKTRSSNTNPTKNQR